MIFARESTTPGRDFLQRIVLGLAVVGVANVAMIAFHASVPLLSRVEDCATYRRVAGLAALHDMDVLSVAVDGRAAIVTGIFKKRRCDFLGGTYYTRDGRGILFPAAKFESLVVDAERNRIRPPSPEAQVFGPWRITSDIAEPKDLVIYVTMTCPEGIFTQKLADVPWRDLPEAAP